MLTICDTHVVIFWQDAPGRLSKAAAKKLEHGLQNKTLACSDITLWEISMLIKFGRLRQDISIAQYLNDLMLVLSLKIIPITPEIAAISQEDYFSHKDPADRIIGATAICYDAPLITADTKLQEIQEINTIW